MENESNLISNFNFVEDNIFRIEYENQNIHNFKAFKNWKISNIKKNMEKMPNYFIVSMIKSIFMFQIINVMKIIHIIKLNSQNVINIFAFAVHQ